MKPGYLIATFFYTGYFPKAPGTAGSLAALLCLFLIDKFAGFYGILIFLILTTVSGFMTAGKVALDSNTKDPSFVVIDEAAGLALSTVIAYSSPYNFILSFVFFRVFDITKIMYINKVEKFKGSAGIMSDDLLAGLYSGITVLLITRFLLPLFN